MSYIFLAVPHVDDEDADYFRFYTLRDCVDYIFREEIVEFRITTDPELPEGDYTLIER